MGFLKNPLGNSQNNLQTMHFWGSILVFRAVSPSRTLDEGKWLIDFMMKVDHSFRKSNHQTPKIDSNVPGTSVRPSHHFGLQKDVKGQCQKSRKKWVAFGKGIIVWNLSCCCGCTHLTLWLPCPPSSWLFSRARRTMASQLRMNSAVQLWAKPRLFYELAWWAQNSKTSKHETRFL